MVLSRSSAVGEKPRAHGRIISVIYQWLANSISLPLVGVTFLKARHNSAANDLAARAALVDERCQREAVASGRDLILRMLKATRWRYAVAGTTPDDMLHYLPDPCPEQRRIIGNHAILQAAYHQPGTRRIIRLITPLTQYAACEPQVVSMCWHEPAEVTFKRLEAQWADGALIVRECFVAWPKR